MDDTTNLRIEDDDINTECLDESKLKAKEKAELNLNYTRLRVTLGVLGMIMPLVIFCVNGFQIEPSISEFYYTDSMVVFTGILIAFGLFLLSYKGFGRDKGEKISDNAVTNMAGVFVLIVAFVPTQCSGPECTELFLDAVAFGHQKSIVGKIHLISAALFLISMGYMSFVQFAKEGESKSKDCEDEQIVRRRCIVYKFSGIMIWLSLLFLALYFVGAFGKIENVIFWIETIALEFFGISWLVKSKQLTIISL